VHSHAKEEHPRRIRGQEKDTELDHFRKDRLQLRKGRGPDKYVNALIRALTSEELEVIRECADQALRDAKCDTKGAEVLTEEVIKCTIRLLHKGGETSDKPSDWRPIGLLNVWMQRIHHVINYRLTVIREVENITVPGQDGGRAGRGVDLCLAQRRGSARTCTSRCTLTPAARAARSAYSRLAARRAIRSGTRYAKWAGGSRSQTHRRAAMCGFTQDDGYVRGAAPTQNPACYV
jgi:hypothetical protein